jgi:RNA polymerase sigma-70 factor (ECF subfamily)
VPNAPPRPPALPTFKELYREYFNFVWSTARRFGVWPSEMEDVIQEVFMVIHSRLHTLQKPESLRSWVYSVTRRTASNHRRARRADANQAEPGYREAPSREPTPLENAERNLGVQLLLSLLSSLSESRREIFALVEIDELSVPEAAEILDIPVNTAYSRLRTARQAFEAALARHEARNGGK